MSEDAAEYDESPKGELKLVRLRYSNEDIIGYVTYKDEYLVIQYPLRVNVETYFDEGRQILSMQECLPQTIISLKEIEFLMTDIIFSSPVLPQFVEQYEHVRDFFYFNESNIKSSKKNKKQGTEETKEKMEKVVSILEAMQAKKDKPVH
jgi:hypothetical protein